MLGPRRVCVRLCLLDVVLQPITGQCHKQLAREYHHGHVADPTFMGTCVTLLSSCTSARSSFQSRRHTGNIHVYNTSKNLGWRPRGSSHRMANKIANVLEAYDEVPGCEKNEDRHDIFD